MSSSGAAAGAAPAVLRAEGLVKSFVVGPQRLEVLRGVDLTVRRNELLAIRGPSGAGKSTLLHILGLLEEPDQGRVWIDGVDVLALGPAERAAYRAARIGFVFQFYHLLRDLDALENVCLARMVRDRPRRYDRRAARARAAELLAQVGLAARLHHRPPQLSGGERQRVAIARALMNEPEVVLCDEPTGNLDQRTAQGILELLWELKRTTETTFVIVTHDAQVAARADRELHMSAGRLEA